MATVFFTDMETTPQMGLLSKVEALVKRAGLEDVIEAGKLVAIKLHFGEYGNLAYIRPNYLKAIADQIKELGGVPFLTDANTLYKGSRANAVDHMKTASLNGFTMESVGAPVVIADGLRGSDEIDVEIAGEYIKKAKIASAIALADALVVVSHFKGHEQTGFGGALKNIGMGSASRAGKMEQHSESKPVVREANCVACGMCERNCPTGAITVQRVARIDYDLCIGCGQCIAMCNYGAMSAGPGGTPESLSKKIAEYALAASKGKKALYISFINNVSPDCDCWHINRPPVVEDIGIVASRDPVALDKACIDLVIKRLGYDPFEKAHPGITWHHQLEHAESIGLGKTTYRLQKVACFGR